MDRGKTLFGIATVIILSGGLLYGRSVPLDLAGTQMYQADLNGKDLEGISFRKASLSHANLGSARLCGADLREADLTFANLCGADLTGANLSGADLRGTTLQWARLNGANLRGIRFDRRTAWPDDFDPQAFGIPPETFRESQESPALYASERAARSGARVRKLSVH